MRGCLRILVAALVCMACPGLLPAQDLVRSVALTDAEAGSLAEDAAAAYERGDFPAAARQYQRLLEGGRDGAAIYYNLGNSLYRTGRTGEAIVAWERARRLDPADEAIRDNLEFAGARIIDRVTEDTEAEPLWALWDWHGRIPPLAGTVVFLIIWWGFNACLSGALFARALSLRRAASYLLPISLLGVLLSGLVLGLLVYRRDVVVEAIVQPARVDLLSAPGEGSVRLTTVHEGLKVRLQSRRGAWAEVLLPNGLRGWVPADAVAGI
jgi:tetratricopeptide (TPR) repeat protein